jgi:hypothetical protein
MASTNGRHPRLAVGVIVGDEAPRSSDSTPWGWSANRVTALALGLTALVAGSDALVGHRLILIGLLIVGPCCALLTGRWAQTALAGACAVGLAVILGVPDRIWGTAAHLAFLAAVLVVALVNTLAALIIERSTSGR